MKVRKPNRKMGTATSKIPHNISTALKTSMDRRKNIKATLAKSAKDFKYDER